MERRDFLKFTGIAVASKMFFGFSKAFAGQPIRSNAKFNSLPHGDIVDILKNDNSQRLMVIAGRPSMGKTAFLTNLASSLALRAKESVAYFSLEMSKEPLMMRFLSQESQIPMAELRCGRIQDSNWDKLINASEALINAKFLIDDGIRSPEEIRTLIEKLLQRDPSLKYVFIDYLQIVPAKEKFASRRDEVANILEQFKKMAHDLNIVVIAAAQLNRGTADRVDRRPRPEDLREVTNYKSIDELILIYRDDYYDKDHAKPVCEITKYTNKLRSKKMWVAKFDALRNRFHSFEKS